MIKVALKGWWERETLFLYRKYISEGWSADRVGGNSDFTYHNDILEKSYHRYGSLFALKQINKDEFFIKDHI